MLSILSRFTTHEHVLVHASNKAEKRLADESFKKVSRISNKPDLKHELYWKDRCRVLQQRIAKTASNNLFLQPTFGWMYTHPFNLKVGQEAVPAVEKNLKRANIETFPGSCKNKMESSQLLAVYKYLQ